MKRATLRHYYMDEIAFISIHALVKRATGDKYILSGCRVISIHALVKRATAVAHTGTVSDVDFNPRPREEGDVTTPRAL